MMAHGTPDLIIWMWCDGSLPFRSEDLLREFAAVYRALPQGRYAPVSKVGRVFLRKLVSEVEKRQIFYVANTNREATKFSFAARGRKVIDLVSGQPERLPGGDLEISLQPAAIRVFRVEGG